VAIHPAVATTPGVRYLPVDARSQGQMGDVMEGPARRAAQPAPGHSAQGDRQSVGGPGTIGRRSAPLSLPQAGRPDTGRGYDARALPVPVGARPAFGIPNLRRNVCPHFYMTGGRGALPIHAPHLLKALARQDSTVSRCQLRGGVHLEQGYVSDVCLSARFNQCVFYEDELSRR
jgi:hypothetical protein